MLRLNMTEVYPHSTKSRRAKDSVGRSTFIHKRRLASIGIGQGTTVQEVQATVKEVDQHERSHGSLVLNSATSHWVPASSDLPLVPSWPSTDISSKAGFLSLNTVNILDWIII